MLKSQVLKKQLNMQIIVEIVISYFYENIYIFIIDKKNQKQKQKLGHFFFFLHKIRKLQPQ